VVHAVQLALQVPGIELQVFRGERKRRVLFIFI